jgi:hypothetical protein
MLRGAGAPPHAPLSVLIAAQGQRHVAQHSLNFNAMSEEGMERGGATHSQGVASQGVAPDAHALGRTSFCSNTIQSPTDLQVSCTRWSQAATD